MIHSILSQVFTEQVPAELFSALIKTKCIELLEEISVNLKSEKGIKLIRESY